MIYTFLNPYSYNIARKNKKLFNSMSGVYIDGELLCKFIRAFTGMKVTRKSFDATSMARIVFNEAIKKRQTIFFIGTTAADIAKANDVISKEYKELNIIGYNDGYINEIEDQIINKITLLKPDVVVVGMGTPLQESFLIKLKSFGWEGVGYTCGGFFHQIASSNSLKYYPDWVNRYNMRWVYRIYDEPKLLKRYLIEYPIFAVFFIYDTFFNNWWKELNIIEEID